MLHLRDGHSHYFQFVGEKEKKRNSQVQSNARCGGNSAVRNSTSGFSLYCRLALLCFIQKNVEIFTDIRCIALITNHIFILSVFCLSQYDTVCYALNCSMSPDCTYYCVKL